MELQLIRVLLFAEISRARSAQYEQPHPEPEIVDPGVRELRCYLTAAIAHIRHRGSRGLKVDDPERVFLLGAEIDITLTGIGPTVAALRERGSFLRQRARSRLGNLRECRVDELIEPAAFPLGVTGAVVVVLRDVGG